MKVNDISPKLYIISSLSKAKTYRIYKVNISSRRSLHIDTKTLSSRLYSLYIKIVKKVETQKSPMQSPPCLKEGGPSQTVGGFRRGTTEGGGGIQKRDYDNKKESPSQLR